MAWLPFERDLEAVRAELPRFEKTLKIELGELGLPGSVDSSRRPGVFGRVGFLPAAKKAIDLINEAFGQTSLSQLEPRSLTLLDLALRDNRVRTAAEVDLHENYLDRMQRLMTHPPCETNELIHDCSNLDVFECFLEYAEEHWGEAGWREAASPGLLRIREVIDEMIATDGRHGGPWVRYSFDLINFPWLPPSFWWHHLP